MKKEYEKAIAQVLTVVSDVLTTGSSDAVNTLTGDITTTNIGFNTDK